MSAEGAYLLSDAEVLRRTAAGDRSAFEDFVERYEAAVLRYVRAWVRDDDQAEDALQETFIAAWRGAAGFRGPESARGWVLRIARNTIHRQFRRHGGESQRHVPLEELALEAGWGDLSSEKLIERLDAHEQVEAGFARLAPEDREILILRDLEGFSGEDVAGMLGLSLAAVKSRLHRARLRFIGNLKGGDRHAS